MSKAGSNLAALIICEIESTVLKATCYAAPISPPYVYVIPINMRISDWGPPYRHWGWLEIERRERVAMDL